MAVTVTAASAVDFTSSPNPPAGAPGLNVTFADASTAGGTSYAWTFGAGAGRRDERDERLGLTPVQHRRHVHGHPDRHVSDRRPSRREDRYVTIAVSQCTAPSLDGVKRNERPGRLVSATASPGP